MPDRFRKNKWLIRTIYVIVFLALFSQMVSIYFLDNYMFVHRLGLDINFRYLPFILIGSLFGYFLALNAYLVLFITAVFLNSMDAFLLTPYMIVIFLYSIFSQYRWFRTKEKTISAFICSYLVCLIFESLNNEYMIKYDFEMGRINTILNHTTGPLFSCLVGCFFLYIFFNHAPDFIKGIFPLGYMYTREYVENLILQNSIKKTRISTKISTLIIIETVLLSVFSIIFISILFPDLRHMMNDGLRQTRKIGDDIIFRYNNYGIAFTVKMIFMELSIAVPIAANIHFYAKTRIGSPIGQLSNYMLKFTDTNDENRTEYLQTIKSNPINTHDEITDLYYSMMITLNEVTGYIERIKEEQKLEEDLRVAEAASEAKSSFLSNMSHEIRTPINAVLGMNEMILRESFEPSTLEYASTIQSAGNTLLSLVNDILDFSKIEAGKMDILPVQYNLSSVINDLVNMILRRAKDKNLELKVNVSESIPDLLFGDEIRIKQCATNILTNAVKYTEKGSVTLDISFEKLEEYDNSGKENTNANGTNDVTVSSLKDSSVSYGANNETISSVKDSTVSNGTNSDKQKTDNTEYITVESENRRNFVGKIALKIRVIDTGIGIKEEDINKLYSPFERIEEIRNRSIEGTGLGMSIVKKLLAMMNTRLTVESVYGEGSDFSFVVEQEVCDWEPIGDFEKRYKETISTRKKYHESFVAPDAKILVVDDTSMNLTVIIGLLKKTLIQIITATSGREALGLVAKEKFDLIFLDHRMPDMDGIETLDAIKKLPDNPNSDTLCIALTANAVAGAREFYLNAGFEDYLSKPIDPARLENMLAMYLPEDKVHKADPSGADEAESSGDFNTASDNGSSIINFNIFSGINMEEAIKNCGSKETALMVIDDFKINLPDKYSAIKEFESTDDIKNFTIHVHSLKSSARIIGAGKLSELAAELEMLGDKWNESSKDPSMRDTIHEKTIVLLDMLGEYLSFWGLSADESSNEESDSKPVISPDELDSAFNNIKELMEAFDYDNASEIYKMLSDYTIPADKLEKYNLTGKYLASVDREKLLELL